MRMPLIAIALGALVASAPLAIAQGNRDNAPGQDRVCLVSFKDEASVSGGANVDVVRARYLPRNGAEAQEGGVNKIFEYGDRTEEVCNCLNDPGTRATCQ